MNSDALDDGHRFDRSQVDVHAETWKVDDDDGWTWRKFHSTIEPAPIGIEPIMKYSQTLGML